MPDTDSRGSPLGSDNEAEATAQGGHAEAKKVTTRVECHRALGIVAARRGDTNKTMADFDELPAKAAAGVAAAVGTVTGIHIFRVWMWFAW